MTAQKPQYKQSIVIRLGGIFLCGILAWGVQQQPVCSWLQGLTLLMADHQNIDRLRTCTRNGLQKIERRRRMKKEK